MTRGIVVAPPATGPVTLRLPFGEVVVEIDAEPYDPVTDERERLAVSRAADAADEIGGLLTLLAPRVADAMARLDADTLEAGSVIWLVARLHGVTRGWRGVLDSDGRPLPLTVESWQLACMTVPGFARLFLAAWMSPRITEIAAGNA
ncbi:MAG: hypothetical protein VYD87_16450 [Pseudomonadota bacterium]|nr:hypothetical protein [Pseudomonadota bacterium]MEE3098916.1 hypothetical protein [Pseudomonadota bacterium]